METGLKLASSSLLSFEGYPLQVTHKQDWGRGFILLLPQTAALPESDVGSGVIKLARISIIRSKSKNKSVKKRGTLNKVHLKVICFNAYSIVNKLTLLHNFLVNNDSIDLIFITESWLTTAILDSMICPNSYCIVCNESCW